MTTITIKIDDNLALWLRGESRRLGRPTSGLVRDALERLRDGQGAGSVLSLIEETVGTLRSGVDDLASNQKHLQGFGSKYRPARSRPRSR